MIDEKNKKGMSEIISTVLIILMTLAAAVLIYSFVVPLVRDNLQRGSECLDYQDYFSFVQDQNIGSKNYALNCQSGNSYVFVVKAKGNMNSEKISGFLVSFSDKNGLTKTVQVKNGDKIGKLRMLDNAQEISIPKSGDSYTYVYDYNSSLDYAEIYPIISSGRVCETANDKIEFIECSADINLGEIK
jgi:flagellin-like protein